MTVLVALYERNGLCRGPMIPNATFRRAHFSAILPSIPPQPLTGDDCHIVTPPTTVWFAFDLTVETTKHQRFTFTVNDGERHEVWLNRNP